MISCPWCNYSHPNHLTSIQCLQCGASFENLYLCPNRNCVFHRKFQGPNRDCQACNRRLLGEFSGRNISWGNAVYRVREFIGGGGMGEVYRGIEQDQAGTYSREVAIKFNKNMVDPEIVKRFQREVQVLNMLQNPHNIRVYTYGELYEERPTGLEIRAQFMVMELLEGITLDELLKQNRRLPIKDTVSLFIQVCSALGEAHQKGVIHRDIKPHNIMLQELGGEDRFVKVFDFGLSRVTHSLDAKLSTSGVVMGTFRYMSPEQALGEEVDHRSDIFSLGVVLYEVLSGRHPFPAKNLFDLFNLHQKGPPPLEEVPPELEAIVFKALAYEKAHRYQTIDELRRDLELWLREGRSKAFEESSPKYAGLGPKDSEPEPAERALPVKSKKTSPAIFIAVAVLLVLVVGGIGIFSLSSNSERDEKSNFQRVEKTTLANAVENNVPKNRGVDKPVLPNNRPNEKGDSSKSSSGGDGDNSAQNIRVKKDKEKQRIDRKSQPRKKRGRSKFRRKKKRNYRKNRPAPSNYPPLGKRETEVSKNAGGTLAKSDSPPPLPFEQTGGDKTYSSKKTKPAESPPLPSVRKLPPPKPSVPSKLPSAVEVPKPRPKPPERPKLPSCPTSSPPITYSELDSALGRELTPRTSRLINRAANSTVYDSGLSLSQSWRRAKVICKRSYLCGKIKRLLAKYCRRYRPYKHCGNYRVAALRRGGKQIFVCHR